MVVVVVVVGFLSLSPYFRGDGEIAGALKTQVLENASTEKASTKQRISQGWKTHVRKTQVRICRDVKCKYGKCKYSANLQSDKKKVWYFTS